MRTKSSRKTRKTAPTKPQSTTSTQYETDIKYNPPGFVVPNGIIYPFEALRLLATSANIEWPLIDEIYLRSRRKGSKFLVRRPTSLGHATDFKTVTITCDANSIPIIQAGRAAVRRTFQFLIDGIQKGFLKPFHAPKHIAAVQLEKKHFASISLQYFQMISTGSIELLHEGSLHHGLLLFSASEITDLSKRLASDRGKLRRARDEEKRTLEECLDLCWSEWCTNHPEFERDPKRKPIGFGVRIVEFNSNSGDDIREALRNLHHLQYPMSRSSLTETIRLLVKEKKLIPGGGSKKSKILDNSNDFTQMFRDKILSFHIEEIDQDDSDD